MSSTVPMADVSTPLLRRFVERGHPRAVEAQAELDLREQAAALAAGATVPPEAISAGWHEFRHHEFAVIDEPSEAFQRGLRAAAPLIERAVLERVVGRRGDLSHDEWAEQIVDRARTRLAELRAGRP